MISRRTFVNGIAAGVAGSALTSSAKSYAQIVGANDRLSFAICGLNGRGYAHLSALQANKQIAAELNISIKTVEKHRQQVMNKLGIHDVAGLTRHAIAKGIIETSAGLRAGI